MTGLAQITDGGKYLIAAKAASGAYYVVNPSSAGEKYKHVAKVVEENVPVEEELAVALGTTKDYNDGGEKRSANASLHLQNKAMTVHLRFPQ